MKRKITITLVFLGLVGTIAIFSACGGGGGSNDNGGTQIPTSYTGSTTQAVITADNAVAIVQHLEKYGFIAGPAKAAERLLGQSSSDFFSEKRNISNFQINGSCGGYSILNLQWTTSTNSFNGNIDFNDYCDEEGSDVVYLTGYVPFEGTASQEVSDSTGGVPANTLDLQLTLNDLMYRSESDAIEFISGAENYAYYDSWTPDNYIRYNHNYILYDKNNKNKTYRTVNTERIFNYVIFVGPDEFIYNGRFYDYDYGFVDIETDGANGAIVWTYPGPVITGALYIVGANSKAMLEINADGSNLLSVDADNDGAFDDGSFVNVPWSFWE